MKDILIKIGLTEKEAEVYIQLLKMGSSPVGEIVKKTGMHRTTVYDVLNRLTEKGLAGSILVNDVLNYRASRPARLRTILEDKEKLLDSIMPDMKKLSEIHPLANEVRYFKGNEGIKTIYLGILETGEDYVGYGSVESSGISLDSYLKNYIQKKQKKKIKARLIFNKGTKRITKDKLTQVRYLDNQGTESIKTRIYADKVAIMLFSKDEPFAILLKNKEIADDFRKKFELLWFSVED